MHKQQPCRVQLVPCLTVLSSSSSLFPFRFAILFLWLYAYEPPLQSATRSYILTTISSVHFQHYLDLSLLNILHSPEPQHPAPFWGPNVINSQISRNKGYLWYLNRHFTIHLSSSLRIATDGYTFFLQITSTSLFLWPPIWMEFLDNVSLSQEPTAQLKNLHIKLLITFSSMFSKDILQVLKQALNEHIYLDTTENNTRNTKCISTNKWRNLPFVFGYSKGLWSIEKQRTFLYLMES